VDPRFNSQQGLYEIFEQADNVPGMIDIAIGEWLAWPAIKVLLYSRLFNALDDMPMSNPAATRALHGAALGSRLPSTWLRLRSALAAIPARSARPRVAWLSGSYVRRGSDGVARDAIFAELPAELAAHADQVWLQPPLLSEAAGGIHAETVSENATDWANQLSPLQRFRPAVRAAADAVAEKLTTITANARDLSWRRLCLDALATFEARRMAWTPVFAKLRPDLVIMTSAPYLSGETAAARSCGATVVEFQHGLFGPRCPEYGWPGSFAGARARMPVADKLFVFGDLFAGAAIKNGFWRAADLRPVGSAAIERARVRPPVADRSITRKVVFLTQPATRVEAIAFWKEMLAGVAAGNFPPIALTIKVHPSERNRASEYAALAADHALICRLSGPDDDAVEVMLDHDIVAGYTSYGLIEAVGLGRMAVSISGPQTPGGVFALCPIPGAGSAIPTVSSPADLALLIAQFTPATAAASARGFFAPQPPGALLRPILELL
jgi:hypothetical protein